VCFGYYPPEVLVLCRLYILDALSNLILERHKTTSGARVLAHVPPVAAATIWAASAARKAPWEAPLTWATSREAARFGPTAANGPTEGRRTSLELMLEVERLGRRRARVVFEQPREGAVPARPKSKRHDLAIWLKLALVDGLKVG